MPRIRIEGDGRIGTRVYLNDMLVPDLTNVQLSHPVEDVLRVHLSVLGTQSLDVRAEEANVTVQVMAMPGYRIVATPNPDGTTWYRSERDVAIEEQ